MSTNGLLKRTSENRGLIIWYQPLPTQISCKCFREILEKNNSLYTTTHFSIKFDVMIKNGGSSNAAFIEATANPPGQHPSIRQAKCPAAEGFKVEAEDHLRGFSNVESLTLAWKFPKDTGMVRYGTVYDPPCMFSVIFSYMNGWFLW